MVDLSQKKPLKPEPVSNVPANDKPPITQPDESPTTPTPGEPTKPLDDISTPPTKDIKDEEKIVSLGQEKIKKELSELGIPPEGRGKKTRVLLAALGVILLATTLPAAVYLVKQRQEIRRQAAYPTPCKICQGGLCKDSNLAGCSFSDNECATDGDCAIPCKICQGGLCKDSNLAGCSHSVDQCTYDNDCGVPVSPSPTPGVSPSPSPSILPGGFCGGCNKDEGWISGNPGPTECNGTPCNAGGWNYCCWDEDGGGCDICARGPGPGVDCSGNCISLSGLTPGDTVKFCKFYSNNDVSCPYSTGSLDCSNVTVPSNGSITRCIPDNKCGQLEADGYCGVCKDTGCGNGNGNGNGERADCNEPPTGSGCKAGLAVHNDVCRNPSCLEEADCECPPPPGCLDQCSNDDDCPGSLVCQNDLCVDADCPEESDCLCEAICEYCKIFDESWDEITDPSTIAVGQTIRLATFGSTSHAQGITKARFRINGGDWMETTDRHQNMLYVEYTIPEAGSYTIESMVYNPGLGWY